MNKLPVLSGKKLVMALKRHGYEAIRQKGSHVFIESPEGKCTSIPLHGNEDLGKGILKSILRDLGLEAEDLIRMLYK